MLEGRLDDFSLPDLFQLLALTNKTGTLRVRYGDTAGAVIFREGQIVGAFDDVRRTAPGTRMLAAGLIDDAELEAALESTERAGDGGVVAALVDQGAIDEASVAEFRRQQAEDAVFALMRLSEATFSLETGEVPPLAGEVELNTEQLIVEGGRRLSEWAEIRRRVPGRQSVPSLVPDPPGEGPVTVGRQQWRLLALVDGRRTVGDVVDLLGSGEYATSAELSGLVDAGLITVGDRATHAASVRTRGDRLREMEARELGLLRDDPTETPEADAATAIADPSDGAASEASSAEADEAADDAEAGRDAEAGDDAGAESEAEAGDDAAAEGEAEAGDDVAAEGEADDAEAAQRAAHTARPTARPSRSTLAPTLISGIELGDDPETAGQASPPDDRAPAGDGHAAEPAVNGAAAEPAASADAAETAASADAVEPAETWDQSGSTIPDVATDMLGSAEERGAPASEPADHAPAGDAGDDTSAAQAGEASATSVPAGEPQAADDPDTGDEPRSPAAPAPDPLPAAPPQPAASASAEGQPGRNGAPTSADAAPLSEPAAANDASPPPQQPLSNELPAAPDKSSAETANGPSVRVDDEAEAEQGAESRLTRDEDINKAMLLRLIDGVKGV